MKTNPAIKQQRLRGASAVDRHLANAEIAPEGIHQASDELHRFFEQSLDLLCVAGPDGYFKRLNAAWTITLGWTRQALVAKPFLEFVHPDDREGTQAEFGNLVAGTAKRLFENRYRHRDGSYRWLQWSARQMPKSGLIYATARDITRQKWLEREVIDIADREKERLGRELHDGLCQNLAGISALSATLSRTLAAQSDLASSDAAGEITRLLSEAILEARDMARGLGPVSLNGAGLDGALESLALNVEHLFRVSCRIECDPLFPRLHHEIETHLFRIAQEAVSNAVNHGKAKRIEIDLYCRDGQGILNVRDDGIGLPEEAGFREGSGMHTMTYRGRLIGGAVEVRRRSGRGTEVFCALPLSNTPCALQEPDDVGDKA